MGKNKYIPTPERMMELFVSYKKWAKSNPIKVKDWVGGAGRMVKREKERPLTMEGFSIYCFDVEKVTSNIHDYFGNKNNAYTKYSAICQRIKEMVRDDQIQGGMAGIYNPSITQRLNGLTDKTENKLEIKNYDVTLDI